MESLASVGYWTSVPDACGGLRWSKGMYGLTGPCEFVQQVLDLLRSTGVTPQRLKQELAEGVETSGQRDFLLKNGCTLFQGYLFGKPAPIEQLQLTALSAGSWRPLLWRR